jgi:hypothetical protein
MSTKFEIEVTLMVELINIKYCRTDSVSARGREGRGFDSDCETNFLLFKNDLNLSA